MSDDNNTNGTYHIAADQLRSIIERVERLEADKREIAEAQKEVFAEAKGQGYCTKTVRKIIALRKKDPDEVSEEEILLDTYKSALGMA
jgi:uncharacterized protein (UPF0335 family)